MGPRGSSTSGFFKIAVIVAGSVAALLLFFSFNSTAQSLTPLPQSEVVRRLALAPFAYVAEIEYDAAKIQAGQPGYTGFATYIDSATDALTARPEAGSSLQDVAVSPDGTRVYMTDAYEPVLHVFDAETARELTQIPLPGVDPHDPAAWTIDAFQKEGGFPYADMQSCSGGVACTPDGAMVLVTTNAGLQVIDTATGQVTRTLPDLMAGPVAVSFDGERAYLACNDFHELPPRDFFSWFDLFMETEDCCLVCLDLATWQILQETPTAVIGGIAVKPDDSQILFSEMFKKRVRMVDALTLRDLWDASTEPSYSIGTAFIPSGEKAYVVCSAESALSGVATGEQSVSKIPRAEDYFCAVIDTGLEEVVKRIPLQAY